MEKKKLNVYFIDIYEDSISGFTTYKEEFLQCVLDLGYYLHCIILNAPVKDFNIFEENDIEYIKIPNACRRESIGCLLSLYIKDSTTNIFIHNFSVAYPVLEMLKKDFPLSKLVFIIHDFIWASYVNGDIARFKKIIRGEISVDYYQEVYSFYEDGLKSFNIVDKIICLSEDTYNLIHGFYKIDKSKLAVIPNGLRDKSDKDKLHNLRSKLKFTNKDVLFLFVGRLSVHKGIIDLLNSMAHLCTDEDNAYLILFGSFYSGVASRVPDSLKRHIIFMGSADKKQIYQWYQEADFGVIPSYFEQCSYTGIEMKMFSLPVIASDAFGVRCMFDESNSITFHLHKPDNNAESSLYGALKKAMSLNADERSRLRHKSRIDYEKSFSFEKMCANYKENLFDKLK